MTNVMLLVALVCFLLAAAGFEWRVKWVGLGLAFWVLSQLVK